MRQLSRQLGFTLIELCTVMSIIAVLAMAGMPALSDFLANSKLREASNVLVSTTLFARSEAIKRNSTVRVAVQAPNLVVLQIDGAVVTQLRSRPLPEGVNVPAFTADFNGAGQLSPFGTQVNVALTSASRTCSQDVRCPSVLIEAGGSVSQCFTGSCP